MPLPIPPVKRPARSTADADSPNPEEYAGVVVETDGYTGRYLVHCHHLEHEDMAMTAAFET